MKCLIAAAVVSLGVLAQDGYHIYPKKTCQTEHCLISGDIEMGYTSYTDIDGFTVKRLNTTSSFTDVIREGRSDICYTGSDQEVEEIIEGLAGNSIMQYSEGGHQRVEELEIESVESGLKIYAKVHSDYGGYETKAVIPRCE